MKHLRDDDLVLYHAGEIRTAPTKGHLSVCRGCRDRLRALDLDLERLSPRPQKRTPVLPKSPEPSLPRMKLPAWRRLLLRLALAGRDRRG